MLNVRAAQPPDLPAIYELIGELADYERLRSQMVGKIEELGRHLFGQPAFAHALIADWEGSAGGFALYFFNYSTFLCRPGLYLEDLFVRPALRGRGLGLALLNELERRARELNCGRFEWSVLDWNTPSIEFYRRFGAKPMDEWTIYRKELL
jgi:GNAT superfamily N-acetyltransferase